MSTLGQMLDDIADETARSDLDSQTRRCIKNAIQHYQRKRFYFTEDYSQTFNTVANQEYYSSSDNQYIPSYALIDSAIITVNGSRFPLTVRNKKWFDEVSSTTSATGIPSDISYYAQQIRLYPIPQGTYPIRIHGAKRHDDVSATASTNVWFTEGFHLIKYAAKRNLYLDYLKNKEDADAAAIQEKIAFEGIVAETAARTADSEVEPTEF